LEISLFVAAMPLLCHLHLGATSSPARSLPSTAPPVPRPLQQRGHRQHRTRARKPLRPPRALRRLLQHLLRRHPARDWKPVQPCPVRCRLFLRRRVAFQTKNKYSFSQILFLTLKCLIAVALNNNQIHAVQHHRLWRLLPPSPARFTPTSNRDFSVNVDQRCFSADIE